MKRNFFISIVGAGLALVTCITAHAQFADSSEFLPAIDSPEKSVEAYKSEKPDFNPKVGEIFQDTLKMHLVKAGSNLKTGIIPCLLSMVFTMVFYNNRGQRLYTIRNYDETKLPKDVRHVVKSTYYDYAITLVQEIEDAAGTITYLVHLEGKTELINLRANYEMDEFEKYIKSE